MSVEFKRLVNGLQLITRPRYYITAPLHLKFSSETVTARHLYANVHFCYLQRRMTVIATSKRSGLKASKALHTNT